MNQNDNYRSGISEMISKLKDKFGGTAKPLNDLKRKLVEKYRERPERERVFILYGGIASAIIIFLMLIVDPLYSNYDEMKSKIPSLANRVARYKSVVDTTDENRQKNMELSGQFKTMVGRSFEGQTADIVAGNLSELARARAGDAGIIIESTKTGTPNKLDGFEELFVTVSFKTSLSKLAAFMQALEENKKLIVIREAKITSAKESYPDNQVEMLTVVLKLSALRYLPTE